MANRWKKYGDDIFLWLFSFFPSFLPFYLFFSTVDEQLHGILCDSTIGKNNMVKFGKRRTWNEDAPCMLHTNNAHFNSIFNAAAMGNAITAQHATCHRENRLKAMCKLCTLSTVRIVVPFCLSYRTPKQKPIDQYQFTLTIDEADDQKVCAHDKAGVRRNCFVCWPKWPRKMYLCLHNFVLCFVCFISLHIFLAVLITIVWSVPAGESELPFQRNTN